MHVHGKLTRTLTCNEVREDGIVSPVGRERRRAVLVDLDSAPWERPRGWFVALEDGVVALGKGRVVFSDSTVDGPRAWRAWGERLRVRVS